MAATKMTDEFKTEEITIRGQTYRFRELSANEYDEIMKIASGPDDNADLALVLKMMAVKSLIDPQMTAEEMGNKPYPVYSKLLQTVNKLHFAVDETGEAPNS